MEVLITSRTKWGNNTCIGGLEMATGRYLRLLTSTGSYQPSNSPLQIGEVWDLNYQYSPDKHPHIEDVRIDRRRGPLRRIRNLTNYFSKNCIIWNGSYSTLFEGKLKWSSSGSGHINDPKNLPQSSVGFWFSDRDLTWDGSKYYIYHRRLLAGNKRLPYKGEAPPVQTIPAGTLIRVSLAKWLTSEYVEDRCYLQLSGWYE